MVLQCRGKAELYIAQGRYTGTGRTTKAGKYKGEKHRHVLQVAGKW